MPIALDEKLPAFQVLSGEGVLVMKSSRAVAQDIRPLRIGLLNLMPQKIETEIQFARLVGATPLQIDLRIIRMSSYSFRSTSSVHMDSFCQSFDDIYHSGEKFDGLIVTGTPIEHLPFEAVIYWDELRRILDWAQRNVHSTIGVCWGGMAMVKHFHGLEKHDLSEKAFGCFLHRIHDQLSPLLRGFSDEIFIPVSRWAEIHQRDIDADSELKTLLSSDETGPCLVEAKPYRTVYFFNNLEYERLSLKEDYDCDVKNGRKIDLPCNYYPDDNPAAQPENRWRSHAHLFLGNWINEIYQNTWYDMNSIGATS